MGMKTGVENTAYRVASDDGKAMEWHATIDGFPVDRRMPFHRLSVVRRDTIGGVLQHCLHSHLRDLVLNGLIPGAAIDGPLGEVPEVGRITTERALYAVAHLRISAVQNGAEQVIH